MKNKFVKNSILTLLMLAITGALLTGCSRTEEKAGNSEKNEAQKEAIVVADSEEENTSNEDTSKEQTDVPDVTTEENKEEEQLDSYKDAFKAYANDFYRENNEQEDEYSKLGFGLIYFDDDDIPELVLGMNGYYVCLYKYDNGNIIPIIDNWPYGAGGNPGYDYSPKSGIVYNMNSDMAGGEVYENFYKWNNETAELENINDVTLMMRHFDDINGDGLYDWSDLEEGGYIEEPSYYVNDEKVSKEEYDKYRIEGEFEQIYGDMTIDEFNSLIDTM